MPMQRHVREGSDIQKKKEKSNDMRCVCEGNVGDPFIDLINFDLASLRNHISKLNLASRIDHPCILPRSGVGAGSLSAEQLDIALLGAFYGILDKAHDQVFSVVFSCEHCRHRFVSVGQRSPVQSGLDISGSIRRTIGCGPITPALYIC